MKETLETLAARMDNLGARMDRFSERMELRFKHVDERFDRLEDRIERRSKQVDDRFDKVDERFRQVDQRFAQMDQRFGDVDQQFRGVHERFEEVNTQLAKLAIGQDNLREDLKRSLDGYSSLVDKDKAHVNDLERLHDTLGSHHVRIAVLETSGARPPEGEEPRLRSGPALVRKEDAK